MLDKDRSGGFVVLECDPFVVSIPIRCFVSDMELVDTSKTLVVFVEYEVEVADYKSAYAPFLSLSTPPRPPASWASSHLLQDCHTTLSPASYGHPVPYCVITYYCQWDRNKHHDMYLWERWMATRG